MLSDIGMNMVSCILDYVVELLPEDWRGIPGQVITQPEAHRPVHGQVADLRWRNPADLGRLVAGPGLAADRSLDARCKKAGVRQIKIHDTRRTCGSLLAALEVHPRIAMAILRHSKIAMTMEIYTEVPDKATRDALKKLSDFLGGHQNDDAEGCADPPTTAE